MEGADRLEAFRGFTQASPPGRHREEPTRTFLPLLMTGATVVAVLLAVLLAWLL